MVLKLETFQNVPGPIMRVTKKYYTESRRKGISYIQYKGRSLTRLVTSCIGTAL